jgi:hypothetical protein
LEEHRFELIRPQGIPVVKGKCEGVGGFTPTYTFAPIYCPTTANPGESIKI